MAMSKALNRKRSSRDELDELIDDVDFTEIDETDDEAFDAEWSEEEAEETDEADAWDADEEIEEEWEEEPAPRTRSRRTDAKKKPTPCRKSAGKKRTDDDLAGLLLSTNLTAPKRAAKAAESDVFGLSVSAAETIRAETTGAPISPAAEEFKPLPSSIKRKLKKRSFARFLFKSAFLTVVFTVGAWSVYGVSVEGNLDFWRETFGMEISLMTDALMARLSQFVGVIG